MFKHIFDMNSGIHFTQQRAREFRTVVRQININSIRNKFDPLMAAAARNIDILLITEIKFI